MVEELEGSPTGSRIALHILLTLVVVSPWPFGSVHLRTTQAITFVSLFTALSAFLWDGRHGRLFLPPRLLLWSLLGLWALALFQLVPLPASLHHWLAPASAFVWHPTDPAAAAVLGTGPHPISIHPAATRRWLAFATGVASLALAAAPALRERRILLRSSVVIVFSGLAVTTYGLVARVFLSNRLFGVFAVPTVVPFGPFVSKNHFAGYVELTALLGVGLATGLADQARRHSGWLSWIDAPGAGRVVAAWGAAIILILAVPVSLSRGGVLSLAGGLLVFALLRLTTRRSLVPKPHAAIATAAALTLALVALVLVLPHTTRDRILTLAGITSEQSGHYRLTVWRSTVHLTSMSPLVGSGLGAYEDALTRFKLGAGSLRVEHAENDYLEALAESGLMGGLLIGGAIVSLMTLAVRAIRQERRRLPRALRDGALGGLVTALAHAAFDFNLRIPSNALCSAVLVAILIAPTLRPSSKAAPSRTWRSAPLAIVLGLTFLMALATPWNTAPQQPLARVTGGSSAALRRAALEAEIEGRLRCRPASGADWVRLAWTRWPESRTEATSLSLWGATLDPLNPGLTSAAETLQRP